MISLSAIYLGLSNLVELDLSNNFLTSIPVSALTSLNNIKFLNMGSNRIEVMNIYIKIKGTVSANFKWPIRNGTLETFIWTIKL